MELIRDIFTNYCFICAFTGWFSAQIIKTVIDLIRYRKFSFERLMSSGGMPSSHSATTIALAISAGRLCGFSSPIFAVAAVFAFVVMYDAAGVRRAAGEQAKILNKLVRDIEDGKTEYMAKDLKELLGHTPLEVLAGALLGLLIGCVFQPGWF